MKRAVLFLCGEPPSDGEIAAVKASGDTVVCADGAYRYLKGKLRPDVLVGDFDSLTESEVEPGIEIVRFPADKDYTDGHLAADLVADRGFDVVDIYGAFGGRPDMAYANLSLPLQLKNRGVRATLLGGGCRVILVSSETVRLCTQKGATVSIAPLCSEVHIIKSEGLKYPLLGLTLRREHMLGVSNVATAEEVSITSRGEALVFITDRRGDRNDHNMRKGAARS